MHLDDNPSLKARLAENLVSAYDLAVLSAQRDTGLDRPMFPSSNPYAATQALDEGFYPE